MEGGRRKRRRRREEEGKEKGGGGREGEEGRRQRRKKVGVGRRKNERREGVEMEKGAAPFKKEGATSSCAVAPGTQKFAQMMRKLKS